MYMADIELSCCCCFERSVLISRHVIKLGHELIAQYNLLRLMCTYICSDYVTKLVFH